MIYSIITSKSDSATMLVSFPLPQYFDFKRRYLKNQINFGSHCLDDV